ncbi:mps1 binder [Cryptococcus neoformans]|uniref:Mps1 binder n=2 Tax=Cryptococcus neoformans TaxID=5207 RepID=A0A854Q8Y9_CRYNE|nr:mps1 binder [Cryptococcus neoformans var. grubii H99]AUB25995.1 mps1 binder [Cryptococcus neoformans var. grubii]OWT38689.1 mps1 binder [Cryptococcus neoformans var. grubii Bt1]OWZ30530.1 mps1 binder [Cryptococcus neoformans var. grubii AD2-60a]OWZ39285.1 mps1 binder [Cryptococcus neoformans var. grubii AD1-83a]OWZ42303.1 mps1 binder [Cryptococcus neoformans var. grubii C23]OWZ53286.1 mps1 binder [Cryptococcus neoformans var. grubii 125.91]OXC83661.1 mps1 binder [Cryptococcus neoformans v|eukprot:XP_012050534.1 mps1 binder [Cryptococcus neoformans var. grubii H99]
MSGFLNSIGRLRAPKRSPTNTPTQQGFFDPLPSPGVENTSQSYQPPSPGLKPLYLCQPFVKAALVKGSFKTIVAPPKYVDINEWVAINLFDFYHNLNQFYGVLTEFCTMQNCPTMSGGKTLNFLWPDHNQRLVSLAAPTYIDFVMSWLQKLLEDENVFPTKSGKPFDHSFAYTAKHIYKHLFRIFAHLYHAHFEQVLHLSIEAHFNSLFAHFLAFGKEFDLLVMKDLMTTQGMGQGVAELSEKWRQMGILES